jgi:hypothetical protein
VSAFRKFFLHFLQKCVVDGELLESFVAEELLTDEELFVSLAAEEIFGLLKVAELLESLLTAFLSGSLADFFLDSGLLSVVEAVVDVEVDLDLVPILIGAGRAAVLVDL